MLKITTFYLDKQKSFIPKKNWSLPCTTDGSFFSQKMPYYLLTLLVYMALIMTSQKNKLVKIIKGKQSFTWGWSEIVNFMAVTTVVRIRGEGDVNAAWSWGNKFSGHIRQSLPKHSATTFRVPEINKTRFIKIENDYKMLYKSNSLKITNRH